MTQISEKISSASTLVEKDDNCTELPSGANTSLSQSTLAECPGVELAVSAGADLSLKQAESAAQPAEPITSAGLAGFPDIKLPRTHVFDSADNDGFFFTNFRSITKQRSLLFLIVGVLFVIAICASSANWLICRTQNEKAFRQYLDEAQLLRLEQEGLDYESKKALTVLTVRENNAWRNAVMIGTKLGENPRVLGDLYMKVAETDSGKPYMISAGGSVEEEHVAKAIQCYKSAPNATLPLITAYRRLVEVVLSERNILFGDDADKILKRPMEEVRRLRSAGQLSAALKVFAKLLSLPTAGSLLGNPYRVETSALLKDMKNSRLSVEAVLPVVSGLVDSNDTDQVEIRSLLKTIFSTACERAGHSETDYQFMKGLGDRMFASEQYGQAYFLYLRCQGMMDSPQVRIQISNCYAKLHEVSPAVRNKVDQAFDELLRLNSQAFGRESKQVIEVFDRYASAYETMGYLDQAQEMRKQIYSRLMPNRCDYSTEYTNFEAGKEASDFAKVQLLRLYARAGKFAEGRRIYDEVAGTEVSFYADRAFNDLRARANWSTVQHRKRAVARSKDSTDES